MAARPRAPSRRVRRGPQPLTPAPAAPGARSPVAIVQPRLPDARVGCPAPRLRAPSDAGDAVRVGGVLETLSPDYCIGATPCWRRSRGLEVLKGHGTGNDFVLVPDPDASHDLDARAGARARPTAASASAATACCASCPRRPAREVADQAADAALVHGLPQRTTAALAEMCGNGARVFARYLVDAGLESRHEFAIATRGGARAVRIEDDGDVSVDMGAATTPRLRAMPVVAVGARARGTAPRSSCPTRTASCSSTTPSSSPPSTSPPRPHVGAARGVPRRRQRRVRRPRRRRRTTGTCACACTSAAVGETLSCGTGAAAVMVGGRRARRGADRDGVHRRRARRPGRGHPRRRRAPRAPRPRGRRRPHHPGRSSMSDGATSRPTSTTASPSPAAVGAARRRRSAAAS